MRLRTHLLALSFLLLPASCAAAPYLEWMPDDPQTGYRYREYEMTLENGGTYEVPINSSGRGTVFIDDLSSIHYPFAQGRGEVFYIPDPIFPQVREHLGTNARIAWDREGTYEIDAYSLSISTNARNSILAWLVPTAYASEEDYVGSIRFSITHGPALVPPCCSSVAFIPGIQGSALLEGETSLWPPRIWGNDIPRLALTDEGESINEITVDGVLGHFYGASIYSGFMGYLDGLTEDASSGVAEWRALAYDWRYPPEKILAEGVSTPDGVIDLIEEIRSLAENSNTGKVTIVAHSMGGLMGKAIIHELMQQGDEHLVDAFIMVGSPQLGTPQGAAALLHGHDQGIPGGYFLPGIIVNPGSARTIAQNMGSAYNLMPSARYFSEIGEAPITFSGAAFTQGWRDAWGVTVDSYAEFKQFITGTGVSRVDPTTELALPEVLDGTRVQDAEDFHARYDSFEFPESVRVVQVAGWGLPTPKAIDYRMEHGQQSYETLFTREGDGTVVYPSAIASDGDTYFFNIFDYNEVSSPDASHRNLLDIRQVQSVIDYVLLKRNLGMEYVSITKPTTNSMEDILLISTHSPVLLGAQDNQGRFTGIDPDQDQSSGFLMITQEIPGSYFSSIGSDQYLVLPKSGSYNLRFEGSGTGPATIETAIVSQDTVTKVASYTDMPVTPSTVGELEISATAPQVATIELDTNGDGSIDSIITSDSYAPTIGQLITELRTKIQSLTFKNRLGGVILKAALTLKVNQLEKRIAKQKSKKATLSALKASKLILAIGSKGKLIEGDVKAILELLTQIESQL